MSNVIEFKPGADRVVTLGDVMATSETTLTNKGAAALTVRGPLVLPDGERVTSIIVAGGESIDLQVKDFEWHVL